MMKKFVAGLPRNVRFRQEVFPDSFTLRGGNVLTVVPDGMKKTNERGIAMLNRANAAVLVDTSPKGLSRGTDTSVWDLDNNGTVNFRETPELRCANPQKMAVLFEPSVASDSPSKSEGRPTKISSLSVKQIPSPESGAKMMMKMDAASFGAVNEPKLRKPVENIAAKELPRVGPGGVTRSTRIKYHGFKTSRNGMCLEAKRIDRKVLVYLYRRIRADH
ncbi:hypothetical protein F5146DRAFT_996863 [Armillaria mellea]|nr:hypothetical protein F5146DRAFT_996863 [Armillaria mellea]